MLPPNRGNTSSPADVPERGLALLIADLECRRILRLHFTPVIYSSRRNIGVAEPFLNLGHVRVVIQRIGGGGGARAPILRPKARA